MFTLYPAKSSFLYERLCIEDNVSLVATEFAFLKCVKAMKKSSHSAEIICVEYSCVV
jgi:hypothetical protein